MFRRVPPRSKLLGINKMMSSGICSISTVILILGSFHVQLITAKGPTIVSRAGWNARNPTGVQIMKTPVVDVFIHHTASAGCSNRQSCIPILKSIQNYHMSKKWGDIGYNFLVGGDGSIYEGRGWNKVGAHTINYNNKAIAISFIGNFDKSGAPTPMLNAARQLIALGVSRNFLTKNYRVHGHRDASCTACPGKALYDQVKKWPNFIGGKLPGYTCAG